MNNCLIAQGVPAETDQGAQQGKDPADAAAYLTDESRLPGCAEKIFFPQSENDLIAILRAAKAEGKKITVSGGRTGITGGAVPEDGWLVSTEKINRVLGLRFDAKNNIFFLRCQPGITLAALNKMIAEKQFGSENSWTQEAKAALELFNKSCHWHFAPDPTEGSATIGGMIACNASGARTFHYGATRNHISALRLVLADGSLLDIRRNQYFAAGDGSFKLVLPDGQERSGKIPDYQMPAVKNAAGYFAKPGMDLLDLFIGSEGTLGIVTEAELMLIQPPEIILGVIGFFGSEENALDFVRSARGEKVGKDLPQLSKRPLAIEYFDCRALNLLRDQKKKIGSSSEIPALPETAHTAVYIELPTTEVDMEKQAEELMALLEACGSSADTAWTALSPEETEKLKKFRHALPEAINQRIGERVVSCPGLTKLGTDFAVPDKFLVEMFQLYRKTLEATKLEYVIFGHIGNNHVHVNILPKNVDEYKRGKEIYLQLAQTIVKWGGTVSGEHGIGKLKKPFLSLMFGAAGVEEMRRVKLVFDPEGKINPGNMFERQGAAAIN
ncbi:MAG: FAD-binding oxidoreductase [Kiritimatiellia bacterium]|nr:FAD-binding oxidoreductase [Kiritimatiellia bacterium]